ncbi:hypothetical protein PZA11_002736 [Diplocarpon coronariae]|uniref:DUF5672 domain-containing protein n=1 Tax=Diplocarpon coronariae TaxID=2795749 RepID=A0A218YY28_9HELO|nr:hypothetical protein JHW43_008340 [Diplocarpon mali]OWO99875.1 hypothetical protein B2J93_6930 [Marssonina coronariae]
MSTPHATSSSSASGIFVLNRARIILFASLATTWAIASLIPSYKEAVKDIAKTKFNDAIEHLPAVKVDWHPKYDPKTQFNASKVALLIEGRPIPHLVPQLLHMISVVPPDWRFVFIGTNKSVISVSRSFATQYQEANGKLDLVVLPKPWTVDSKEDIHRMLTDIRFYDEFLPGVEWLLKFESDSIMCARSDDSLNDWLHYSWAGAPRTEGDKFAGNGGLSLRRISTVRKVLGFQSRYNDTEPEDEWFGKRITVLPGAKVANGAQEDHFSVEDVWHDKPMGYHVRDGGESLSDNVWKSPDRRKGNFDYCPELAMIMPMKLERERCDGDNKEGEILSGTES